MREYILYYCDTAESKPRYTSEIHAQAIGNTHANEFYRNKDIFFEQYLLDNEKKKRYNHILRKYLHKNDDILSIGSGRCINELYLIDRGYKITCSDVGDLAAKDAPKKLFPMFKYDKINISDEGYILKPGEFVLGTTYESIQLPKNLVGKLDGRSTIARLGILIHCSSDTIDGNHEQPRSIVLEIKNIGNFNIVLKQRTPMAMFVFSTLSGEIQQKSQTQYENQTGVQPPNLKVQYQ